MTTKKPSDDELKAALSPEQYEVTQQCGTEPPFRNAYWNHDAPGIYVDVVSGEPLFSSLDKFDSGTGWPSFTKALAPENLTTRKDRALFMARIEVRSKEADSHLGHVFNDGPTPTGLRFCMNSAALRFVPADRLAAEGYGQYEPLFKAPARAVATFAAGCFWGVEELLRELPGVLATTVGYTGGGTEAPTYEQVKTGRTGHAEAIQVAFDPARLGYDDLLRFFFRLHDPTTKDRQGNDRGTQYRSVIFAHDDEQRRTAERVRAEVDGSGKWGAKVVTEIVPAGPFYPAEDYHQKYLQKNPGGYTCHFLRD